MKRRYVTSTSFVDLLFNVLMGFFTLLMMALILIKPEQKTEDIKLKAEYIITMEWPNDNRDDVDLLVKTPMKQVVYFGNRDVKSASLDRDDMGQLNDVMVLEDGTRVIIKENWEHVTIRKTMKGEYVVNVLMYSKRQPKPTPVTVKIEKLNPYSLVYSNTVWLTNTEQEKTILRFSLNNKGNVVERSTIPYSVKNNIRRRPYR